MKFPVSPGKWQQPTMTLVFVKLDLWLCGDLHGNCNSHLAVAAYYKNKQSRKISKCVSPISKQMP